MAEMVGSLVVGEVVNRTSSFIISKHKERLTTWEGIERLEMAHIKMEAALDISGRWQTTDVSLLRWRRKLRRAADDCDAALHRWKLRALEEEAARERLAREPFRRRVAHAVLSFVRALLALTRGGNDVVARACAAVQRFERLANGSAEFLKCVELSSASRRCCLVSPIVPKLGGKHANYNLLQGGTRCSLLGVGSEGPVEDGVENKTCSGYGTRSRRASGENLLLV
ncbi:hypothetical protein QOZ80_3AG0228990 [Eleusine coracana subsp. coracana]|nr:hypothetical protein QOZ80_3AG0228990 [Eleusine coracana subsp. coracana]